MHLVHRFGGFKNYICSLENTCERQTWGEKMRKTRVNSYICLSFFSRFSPSSCSGRRRFIQNHPMGPLTLADLIGLDVCLYIMEVLYEGFKDPKYRPCPLLRKMMDAGYLGRKTGRGFYDYKT